MSDVKYKIVENAAGSTVSVLIDGDIQVASDDHPNYEEIVTLVRNGFVPELDLFEQATKAAQMFEALSDRVSVTNGRVYFDLVEVDNALTQQISRFIRDGVDDWEPLVNFYERLATNPSEHSREQLYTWLKDRDFTITPEGDIVAYKGVRSTGTDRYESINAGRAIVDGVVYEGAIPNFEGAIVEMPRNEVAFNPQEGCSVGLHAGTYDFARGYGNVLLTVLINPRDVVSVPSDASFQKLRVCRYEVLNAEVTEPYDEAVYGDDDGHGGWGELDDEDLDGAEGWGNLQVAEYSTPVVSVTGADNITTTVTSGPTGPHLTFNVNSQAKLTPDQVREIRSRSGLGFTSEHLASLYNVHVRTIERIVSRKAWAQV